MPHVRIELTTSRFLFILYGWYIFLDYETNALPTELTNHLMQMTVERYYWRQNTRNVRQEQVEKRKRFINDARTRVAQKKGVDPQLMIQAVSGRRFAKPFSDRHGNAAHRRNFDHVLSKGFDLPPRASTTKISLENMTYTVAFVLANSHYRPGKIRNCVVRGSLLKNLPLHLRYSSVRVLYIAITPKASITYSRWRSDLTRS